ncbi:hypothetical protein PybrP1_011289 [[Pythium] brassicae (nom. inval.)]|nr:hypothetical protein PybrP1_011289 [[Pythium] brassicae (nom. inval.)]
MSESKELFAASVDDSERETRLRALPHVNVTAVDVSPNPAPLAAELNLEVDFTLDKPVADGVWDIERNSLTGEWERLQLGQVEATDYAHGENHFQFTATDINTAGIEPSQFTNCGLLVASFKGRDGDIMDLKMVIQVTEQHGALQRIIYSPLE